MIKFMQISVKVRLYFCLMLQEWHATSLLLIFSGTMMKSTFRGFSFLLKVYARFHSLKALNNLQDTEGKEIGRASGYKLTDLASLEEGNTLPIGGKEIEVNFIYLAIYFYLFIHFLYFALILPLFFRQIN